jgi:NAD(P)-dependent dehydrogenase (short-subunit alcohol dehydrogenase family)
MSNRDGAYCCLAATGDDAVVRIAVAHMLGEFGRVDILVNCAAAVAGQGKPTTLAEITDDAFLADMNVKMMAVCRCPRGGTLHRGARQRAHREHLRSRGTQHRLSDRPDPQRGDRRPDEEPCGRTSVIQHIGGVRAPPSYAHRKDPRVRRTTSQVARMFISECRREKSARVTSNHECASLLRRPGVHIATAVEVIIDFGGGADHAAVKEDVEGRGLEVVFSERP